MDVALAIDLIYKNAIWFNCVTGNTREEFDALRWEDDRPKPTWEELESAWAAAQNPTPKTVSE